MQISDGKKRAQEQQYAGAVLAADPQGQLIYVDSASGSDGDNGDNPREALATLTQALALAQAGDTVILNKGGSETITAGLALALARVKIICKTDNPRSGFTLQGAGTLDLLTVSGADCHIEGIEFVHTGATANAAGLVASAAASGLVVKTCSVNDVAIVTTKTGTGIELVAGADDQLIEGCVFLDTRYGVQILAAGAAVSDRPVIRACRFYVGGAAFFGIHAAAATGGVQGLVVETCTFVEADGDGSAATAAWDGTDGTNGTQGPILFGAGVDQWKVDHCAAYTALATSFDLLNAINAGAAGDMIGNSTGEGGDLEDKIDLINPNTNAKVTSGEVIINASTDAAVTSGEVVVNANTDAAVTSGEVVVAAAVTSGEVVVAAAITSGEVVVNASTDAAVTSGEVVINANTDAAVTSGEVVIAAAVTSGEVVVNVEVTAKGRPIAVTKTFDLADIPSNAQSFALFTASGDILVTDVIFSKDGTNLEAMTNLEMTCNNAYGPTGLTSDLFKNVKAGLLANLTLRASAGGVTGFTPMVLEDTKILYLHGDDAIGTTGSNLKATLYGYALTDGASVS